MGSYATNANVAKRLPTRTLSGASKPSTTDVDEWIDDAEAEVEVILRGFGVTVPVSDARAVKLLRQKVTTYATGRWKEGISAGTNFEDGATAEQDLEEWRKFVEELKANPAQTASWMGQAAGSSGGPSQLRSYATDNTDGKSIDEGDFSPRFDIDEDL